MQLAFGPARLAHQCVAQRRRQSIARQQPAVQHASFTHRPRFLRQKAAEVRHCTTIDHWLSGNISATVLIVPMLHSVLTASCCCVLLGLVAAWIDVGCITVTCRMLLQQQLRHQKQKGEIVEPAAAAAVDAAMLPTHSMPSLVCCAAFSDPESVCAYCIVHASVFDLVH